MHVFFFMKIHDFQNVLRILLHVSVSIDEFTIYFPCDFSRCISCLIGTKLTRRSGTA